MSNGLTAGQVADLARPLARLADVIIAYYENEENEKEYQEWYLKKFGKPVPKGE